MLYATLASRSSKIGELQYKAMKHMDEYGYERQKAVPEMLEVACGGAEP
jgi:hypothetical protein